VFFCHPELGSGSRIPLIPLDAETSLTFWPIVIIFSEISFPNIDKLIVLIYDTIKTHTKETQ